MVRLLCNWLCVFCFQVILVFLFLPLLLGLHDGVGFLDHIHQDVPFEAFSERKGMSQQQHCGLHAVSHIMPEVAEKTGDFSAEAASYTSLTTAACSGDAG